MLDRYSRLRKCCQAHFRSVRGCYVAYILIIASRLFFAIRTNALLWTGVFDNHPPGRTDKNLCADVSVPRLAGLSLMMSLGSRVLPPHAMF